MSKDGMRLSQKNVCGDCRALTTDSNGQMLQCSLGFKTKIKPLSYVVEAAPAEACLKPRTHQEYFDAQKWRELA